MCSVIVVTSGKGGVGKTTATANLGAALARRDRRVVLVDADIGLRNLDVVLGLENRIIYDLVDVIEGVCHVEEALIRDKRIGGLYLLPAAQTRDKLAVSPEKFRVVVSSLRCEYDYVIIDCPAGIEHGFKTAIAPADRAIIVTTPEIPSVRDADRVVGLLEASGLREPELIVNRMRKKMVRRGDMLGVDDVEAVLAISVLGVVPEDDSVIVAANRGEPAVVVAGSRAGQAYAAIASRIEGEVVVLADDRQKHGFWRRLAFFSNS